ncbi:hypothetical protein KZ327_08410, partial [Glaesserella parasuis]|nr:hypothetical protein [Glaesserella parasuis]
ILVTQMKLSFKDGNDMLLIGNDMGTGYVNYSGGQPLRKIKVDMGGNSTVVCSFRLVIFTRFEKLK